LSRTRFWSVKSAPGRHRHLVFVSRLHQDHDSRRVVSIHGSSTSSLIWIGMGTVDLADREAPPTAAPFHACC